MPVQIEHDGHIAVVTMDREHALNAFNAEQLRDLIDTFAEIGQSDDIRAVILTGAGSRAFAAGADVNAMATMSRAEGHAFGQLGQQVALTIEHLSQPVLAAVNGYALGGGCEIALACDIRFAAENAVFAQPEVSLGIPPGWGGSQRLPRLIGAGRAAEMILSARRVDAEEALRWGLVNAVYPADQLMTEAKRLAQTIANNSPVAVRTAKMLTRGAFAGDPEAGFASEGQAFGESFESADQREGMAAFVEKRRAEFTGA